MDTFENENLILKSKNVELQEQIILLEKAVLTATEARQSSLNDEVNSDNETSMITDLEQQLTQNKEEAEQLKLNWQTEKDSFEKNLLDLQKRVQTLEDRLATKDVEIAGHQKGSYCLTQK